MDAGVESLALALAYLLFPAIPVGLALNAFFRPWNWARALRLVLLSAAAVIFPLVIFVLSGALTPEWKGACQCGWLDGFQTAKLALMPVILYAIAALVRVELPGLPVPRWVPPGLLCGAVVSTLCVAFGVVCTSTGGIGWKIVLPVYVPVWYVVRAWQHKVSGYGKAFAGMTPFWIASLIWTRRVYEQLPDKAPEGCFVVTAASRGHVWLVGPFFEVEQGGRARRANRQLATLWTFEERWRRRSPGTHGWFRRFYNAAGPRVARRVRSPWVADVVYLLLKPVEWLAQALKR